jgi:hypothetical protein
MSLPTPNFTMKHLTSTPNTALESAAQLLVGKTVDEAKLILEREEIPGLKYLRTPRVNGKEYVVTADYRLDRVNVEVTDGVITTILYIG